MRSVSFELAIKHVIELNSEHLPAADEKVFQQDDAERADGLGGNTDLPIYSFGESGLLIDLRFSRFTEEMRSTGLSQTAIDLFASLAQSASFVLFDCEANHVTDLPVYPRD